MDPLCFYYSATRAKNEVIVPHTHSCWEFVYYKSCVGKTDINGAEYDFDENTFAILPPECPHSEKHNVDGSIYYIGFYSTAISIAPGVYMDDPYHTFRNLMSRIMREAQNRLDDSKVLLRLLISELEIHINRLQAPVKKQPPDLLYAKHFIDENFNWKINFVDLAQSCGYSFESFRYSFKKKFGMSPKSYLIDLRLSRAKALLEQSESSCTEIAYLCGFSDSAQFSTMFRNKYGVSPKSLFKKEKKKS